MAAHRDGSVRIGRMLIAAPGPGTRCIGRAFRGAEKVADVPRGPRTRCIPLAGGEGVDVTEDSNGPPAGDARSGASVLVPGAHGFPPRRESGDSATRDPHGIATRSRMRSGAGAS